MKKLTVLLTAFTLATFCHAQTMVQVIENPHSGSVLCLTISPNGDQILTGGSDSRANLWNIHSAAKIKAFGGHTGKINAVGYKPDGSFFVTGSADNNLIVWDAYAHKPKKILKGHMDEVTAVAFNKVYDFLATASKDKTIIIWNTVSGKALNTIRGIQDEIISLDFSADGKYLASCNGKQILIYQVGTWSRIKALEVPANEVKFANEEKLLAAAGKGFVSIWSVPGFTEAGNLDFKSDSYNHLAFSPDDQYLAASGQGVINICEVKTGKIRSAIPLGKGASAGIGFSNSATEFVACTPEQNIQIYDVSGLKIQRPKVDASASTWSTAGNYDQANNPAGNYRGITNETSQLAPVSFGKYYALVIGINDYSGSWPHLSNAVHDAQEVERTLRDNYQFDYFRTLYNEKATRENIIKELEWLVANVKPNDNVLIYYSGHGDFKKSLNKGYWVPADASTTSISGYISNSVIQEFLNGIQSQHTLLLSDACFSGDIFRGANESVPFENSQKYVTKVYSMKSRQAISSGGLEPVMDGGREGHSVFAYYLLKSLKDNPNKYLDAGQLYSQIKVPVVNNSEQSPIFSPIKNTGDEGGQFIFIKK